MPTYTKILFISGAILTLAGSFLPWYRKGDFFSYWSYGIQIYPSIKNNGGLIIMVLTLILILLIFRPPNFIEKPLIWSILLSFTLVLDSIFYIGKLLVDRANFIGVIGAPTIQIGLGMVFVGSLLLFFSVMLYYFRAPS
jgi:hypothetical protein